MYAVAANCWIVCCLFWGLQTFRYVTERLQLSSGLFEPYFEKRLCRHEFFYSTNYGKHAEYQIYYNSVGRHGNDNDNDNDNEKNFIAKKH